jgi:stage IV sporulation protein FB
MRVVFHPVFLLMILLAMWSGFGMEMVVAICTVVVHEFAHAATARAFKIHTRMLTILPFGAAVEIECESLKKRHQILILISGAAVNLIIAAATLPFMLMASTDLWMTVFYSNVSVAVLNLLPIHKLDGGKICAVLSNNRATKYIKVLSRAVFAALFFFACYNTYYLVAFAAICALVSTCLDTKTEYQKLLSIYKNKFTESV